jgi:hypothetical protein
MRFNGVRVLRLSVCTGGVGVAMGGRIRDEGLGGKEGEEPLEGSRFGAWQEILQLSSHRGCNRNTS